MSRSQWVAPLDAVGGDDIGRVGGKASALGELLRAGLDVPPGFAITCDAFRAHLAGNGIDQRLRETAGTPLLRDPPKPQERHQDAEPRERETGLNLS